MKHRIVLVTLLTTGLRVPVAAVDREHDGDIMYEVAEKA